MNLRSQERTDGRVDRQMRWIGLICLAGGAMWLLYPAVYLVTHGPSFVDNEGTLLGLTWIDYTKMLVLPLLLFATATIALFLRFRHRLGRTGLAGTMIFLAGAALLATGLILATWHSAWGSTNPADYDTPLGRMGFLLAIPASLVVTAGITLFGWSVLKAGVLPGGNWLPLGIGLASFWPIALIGGGSALFEAIFGLGWLALGGYLWARPVRSPDGGPLRGGEEAATG